MEKHLETVSESFNSLLKLFRPTVENAESQKKNKILGTMMINIALMAVKTEVDDEFIEKFLVKSRELWPAMIARNLDHFNESVKVVFPLIPDTFIAEFRSYFDDETIVTEQMKELLWSKVNKMCVSSICYCHYRRNPDPETRKYRDTFAPSVKVREGVELFKIPPF